MYKEWTTREYPKKLNYKSEGRRNIRRPLKRCEDDFWEKGAGL